MKNDIFWSEIRSGFDRAAHHPPPSKNSQEDHFRTRDLIHEMAPNRPETHRKHNKANKGLKVSDIYWKRMIVTNMFSNIFFFSQILIFRFRCCDSAITALRNKVTKVNRLVELGLPVVKNYPCKIRIFTFSFFFFFTFTTLFYRSIVGYFLKFWLLHFFWKESTLMLSVKSFKTLKAANWN